MIQEIIVYIIGVLVIIYLLWRIFRKEKNRCGSCTACQGRPKKMQEKDCEECLLKEE
jgi:7-cyano-7-deazaguanine synthase in queuosine biosynthesis